MKTLIFIGGRFASGKRVVFIAHGFSSDCERYEIVKKIGRGKYSEVFKGVDIVENRPCVIKASG